MCQPGPPPAPTPSPATPSLPHRRIPSRGKGRLRSQGVVGAGPAGSAHHIPAAPVPRPPRAHARPFGCGRRLRYGTGYAIEIFRAGLCAVPDGQHEASAALGLGRVQAFRCVVLPQAYSLMLPPLTNFVVLELKNTTLVYFVGVHEVMFEARLGAGNSGNPLAIYLIAAAIYVVLNVGLGRLGALLERRAAVAA